MKHLFIVLAILILGCGTDTEIVEEPLLVSDEPTSATKVFVVYDIGPTPKGDRGDPDPPQLIKSNVHPIHERHALNPDRLNKDGIFFDFSEDLHRFVVDLSLNGKSLGWIATGIRPGNNASFSILLTPPVGGPFLERGKEYVVDLLAGDKTGDVLEMEIRFRTNR